MAKSREAFRTISEVADWLDVQTHVLRFWESKFSQVKPVKRAGGRRYYRPEDMEILGGIKKLLHEEGMPIKEAQQLLKDKGVKHVAAMSRPIDGDGGSDPIVEETALDAAPSEETSEDVNTLADMAQMEDLQTEVDLADEPTDASTEGVDLSDEALTDMQAQEAEPQLSSQMEEAFSEDDLTLEAGDDTNDVGDTVPEEDATLPEDDILSEDDTLQEATVPQDDVAEDVEVADLTDVAPVPSLSDVSDTPDVSDLDIPLDQDMSTDAGILASDEMPMLSDGVDRVEPPVFEHSDPPAQTADATAEDAETAMDDLFSSVEPPAEAAPEAPNAAPQTQPPLENTSRISFTELAQQDSPPATQAPAQDASPARSPAPSLTQKDAANLAQAAEARSKISDAPAMAMDTEVPEDLGAGAPSEAQDLTPAQPTQDQSVPPSSAPISPGASAPAATAPASFASQRTSADSAPPTGGPHPQQPSANPDAAQATSAAPASEKGAPATPLASQDEEPEFDKTRDEFLMMLSTRKVVPPQNQNRAAELLARLEAIHAKTG